MFRRCLPVAKSTGNRRKLGSCHPFQVSSEYFDIMKEKAEVFLNTPVLFNLFVFKFLKRSPPLGEFQGFRLGRVINQPFSFLDASLCSDNIQHIFQYSVKCLVIGVFLEWYPREMRVNLSGEN